MQETPEDLLSTTFGYLALKEMHTVRQVCSAFQKVRVSRPNLTLSDVNDEAFSKAIAMYVPIKVQRLSILFSSPAKYMTSRGFAQLSSFANLEHMHISKSQFTFRLQDLEPLQNFKSLDLEKCYWYGDDNWAFLPRLNLEHLKISEVYPLGLFAMTQIGQLTNLTSLDIQSQDTNKFLEMLRPLTTLTRLALRNCVHVTDEGLAFVAKSPNLRAVYFDACHRITDAGLAHLSGLLQLEEVTVSQASMLTSCSSLAGLTNLRALSLEYAYQLTDAGFAHIAGLPRLELLNLNCCHQLTQQTWLRITKLRCLTELNLDGTRIDDEGLIQIGKISSLKILSFRHNGEITSAGLVHLLSLVNLEWLNLRSWTNFTEEGVQQLLSLPKLTKLIT